MAPSLEELDATVRAFYEGRGEQVRIYCPETLGYTLEVITDLFGF